MVEVTGCNDAYGTVAVAKVGRDLICDGYWSTWVVGTAGFC